MHKLHSHAWEKGVNIIQSKISEKQLRGRTDEIIVLE